ncbi:MAG: hypothetical protein K6T83_14535, partial [Alicyclobacillus sp.]|nr:hypothetical protein [Alicyclobacillus sp.]
CVFSFQGTVASEHSKLTCLTARAAASTTVSRMPPQINRCILPTFVRSEVCSSSLLINQLIKPVTS